MSDERNIKDELDGLPCLMTFGYKIGDKITIKIGDAYVPYIVTAEDFPCSMARALEARVAELESASRWIPVSERLPKLGELVLFYDSAAKRWGKGALQRTGIEGKHQWNSTERFIYYGERFGDVTHWMIPQPPEVQE